MPMDRLGFKGTDPAMRCRGMQFKMGTAHRHDSKLEMCNSGFHFCSQLKDVADYYPFSLARVFIVQHGAHVLTDGEKSVTDEILFLHEITAATIAELMAAPEYASLMCDNTDGLLKLFAARGDVEPVRNLLDRGADVHAQENYALRWASENGHRDTVAVLLEHGADVHAQEDYALRWASEIGHRNVVALLLDRGADVHAQEDYALRLASEKGHRDTVAMLLDGGADVHADNDGALRAASVNGHRDVVALLLDRGADVHAQEDYALRWASKRGHKDVVRVLLEHGTKPQ
jgi:hypothetical protein